MAETKPNTKEVYPDFDIVFVEINIDAENETESKEDTERQPEAKEALEIGKNQKSDDPTILSDEFTNHPRRRKNFYCRVLGENGEPKGPWCQFEEK